MNASESGGSKQFDPSRGPMAWWTLPDIANADAIDAQAKRYRGFLADLNRLFSEASSRQAQALSAANRQFAGAFQGFLSARRPPELLAAQSTLFKGLMESMAAQAKTWTELTWDLQNCCTAMVRETARDVPGSARQAEAVDLPKQAVGAVPKETAKRRALR